MSNIFQTIKYFIVNVLAFVFIAAVGLFILKVGFNIAKVVSIGVAMLFTVTYAFKVMTDIGLRLTDTTNKIAKKVRNDYGF